MAKKSNRRGASNDDTPQRKKVEPYLTPTTIRLWFEADKKDLAEGKFLEPDLKPKSLAAAEVKPATDTQGGGEQKPESKQEPEPLFLLAKVLRTEDGWAIIKRRLIEFRGPDEEARKFRSYGLAWEAWAQRLRDLHPGKEIDTDTVRETVRAYLVGARVPKHLDDPSIKLEARQEAARVARDKANHLKTELDKIRSELSKTLEPELAKAEADFKQDADTYWAACMEARGKVGRLKQKVAEKEPLVKVAKDAADAAEEYLKEATTEVEISGLDLELKHKLAIQVGLALPGSDLKDAKAITEERLAEVVELRRATLVESVFEIESRLGVAQAGPLRKLVAERAPLPPAKVTELQNRLASDRAAEEALNKADSFYREVHSLVRDLGFLTPAPAKPAAGKGGKKGAPSGAGKAGAGATSQADQGPQKSTQVTAAGGAQTAPENKDKEQGQTGAGEAQLKGQQQAQPEATKGTVEPSGEETSKPGGKVQEEASQGGSGEVNSQPPKRGKAPASKPAPGELDLGSAPGSYTVGLGGYGVPAETLRKSLEALGYKLTKGSDGEDSYAASHPKKPALHQGLALLDCRAVYPVTSRGKLAGWGVVLQDPINEDNLAELSLKLSSDSPDPLVVYEDFSAAVRGHALLQSRGFQVVVPLPSK